MPLKRTLHKESLLLDTHIFIWLMASNRSFVRRLIPLINIAKETCGVYLSIASIWEIGMLASRGRLNLALQSDKWMNGSLKLSKIKAMPLSIDTAMMSSFDFHMHKDPIDRILVRSAIEHDCVLITCDRKIHQSAQHSALKTFHPKLLAAPKFSNAFMAYERRDDEESICEEDEETRFLQELLFA